MHSCSTSSARNLDCFEALGAEPSLKRGFAPNPHGAPTHLSVSNSSSGRRWKLDHSPAVGDPTHMVEFGTGRRAFAREA